MITMEYDEMKKIWDEQNNQPLYAIDEKALHNRIQSRMNAILRVTNISDWVLIMIYLGTGIALLRLNPVKAGANIFMWLETAWMFATSLYIVVGHIRRIKANCRFDRSILGDLDHAIFLASYQMRLSQFVGWNLLPMGAIMIFSGWESGKFLKVSLVILVSYTLAVFVISKGYNANKRRKRELQSLKAKLEAGN
jgi:hypothetical protein